MLSLNLSTPVLARIWNGKKEFFQFEVQQSLTCFQGLAEPVVMHV
jgi:hypothetical protein